jgi:hypothetical protein
VNNPRFLLSAFALAAIGTGVCACTPTISASGGHTSSASVGSAQTAAGGGTLTGSGSSFADSTGPGSYVLQAMPAGTVTLSSGQGGQMTAKVNLSGLTPGSSHDVSIDGASSVVHFPVLTANSAGQADATLTSTDLAGRLPAAGRFVVRLGSGGASAGALAAEPIAESRVLPRHLEGTEEFTFHPTGGYGHPSGRTTISYNASSRTLTVTVSARGLTPGPHAAHIHVGSCLSQGPVAYMLADFVADANGAIVGQTRVVSGVTSVPAPGTWYLNLHQGSMNQILAGGAPTLLFRPMLCTDITSIATTGATPSASPSAVPSMSASGMATTPPSSPSGSPSSTPAATPSVSPSQNPTTGPTATPSPNPGPTHW